MRTISKQYFDLIDIEVTCERIKSNNNYSLNMEYLIKKLNDLNMSLEKDIEYPYDELLNVYHMLMKMQTWKHIKVADKHKLIELQKDMRINIDRINTTFDL